MLAVADLKCREIYAVQICISVWGRGSLEREEVGILPGHLQVQLLTVEVRLTGHTDNAV